MMIATILLAGGLVLVGLLSGTYLLVQRKLQTLDDEAFRNWFMRVYLGMNPGKITDAKQGIESKAAGRTGRRTQQRSRSPKSERPDQVEAGPA